MGVWVYVSSSSLFIQLQISEQQVYTHYLPFMGWQVLVKITIFRMDRLEPPPSKISRFTKIIPHIYIYVCTRCMVYGVFYQSRYGFLANFFARRLRDRFKKPFEYFSRCFCLEFSRAESFFSCMKKRIGYKNYYYISI